MNSLFEPLQSATDKKYLLVRSDSRFEEQRSFLESLWKKYRPFADPNFKSELASQFHPRFWEMYLSCAFLELGFDLLPRKSSYGPDIQIALNNKKVWVEATAPDEGNGDDAVPGYSNTSETIEWTRVPEEKIILRLTNSFFKKRKSFEEYISSGIVSENDICVIAINGFDIPHIFTETEIPYIVKSVLPFGDLSITLDINEMKPTNEFYTYRDNIQKRSGAPVSTKAFQDPANNFISGLLYSTAELWNLPSSLGFDFRFLHNPLAKQSLDKKWIGRGMEFWVENNQLKWQNG